jgi:hypothetical protein
MALEQNESYPVKRGKFDSLTIFDVTEQELNIIENGSTNSLFLNFAIFLISTSTSFFISIFTVDWFPKGLEPHLISYIVFLVIAILTLLVGMICIILWIRSHDSFKDTIRIIRRRLVEEKMEDPEDDESVDVESTEE